MTAARDAELVDRVRRRLADGLDGVLRGETEGIVDDAVFARMRREVGAELQGAGPLDPLLATPGVTDVLVNGPREVWLDRGAGMERAPVTFHDDAAVRRLAQRLVTAAGGRLDDAQPYADAVLADGTRLHAVLPPLVARPTISLRVLARHRLGLTELIEHGSIPTAVADTVASAWCAETGPGPAAARLAELLARRRYPA